MDICSLDFYVTLPDVGENDALSNKGILRIMQESACVHSSFAGISVSTSRINGLAWVILNWKLKVYSRPSWNTKLKVNTWCRKLSHIFFYRDFEIYDENNNLVAIATSKWILYDLFNNSIAKIDDKLKSIFILLNKSVFDEPFEERLIAPEDYISNADYTILKRDIDTNHHVNNLNYLDFAYEALPENHFDFKNVEILYKNEAKLGDSLNLLYSKKNNESFVTIKNDKNGKIHCVIKLY